MQMGASVNGLLRSAVSNRNDAEIHIQECVSWETTCWGCGLRVVLPRHAPMFRCGWCGAITSERTDPKPPCNRRCSKVQQIVFVSMVFAAVMTIICAGIWATFPVLFSTATMEFYLHSAITAFLSFNTLFNFCMAAFQSAGPPPEHHDGKLIVVKHSLVGYKFCGYCERPKPPNAHHCRSCHSCVVEMDHHCPFIGNCVGSNNLRHFLLFLVFAMASGFYLVAMTLAAGSRIWPSLITRFRRDNLPRLFVAMPLRILAEVLASMVVDLEQITSIRAFVLFYLFVASLGLVGGVGVLLYQQLRLVCASETYIHSLISDREMEKVRSWGNLRRVFGKRHPCLWLLPSVSNSKPSFSLEKTH